MLSGREGDMLTIIAVIFLPLLAAAGYAIFRPGKVHRPNTDLFRSQRGQCLLEYALMMAFVVAAAVAIMPDVANIMTRWTGFGGGYTTYIRTGFGLAAIVCLVAIVYYRHKHPDLLS